MTAYVAAALFVYSPNSEHLLDQLQDNDFGTTITPLVLDKLLQAPETHLANVEHVLVAGSMQDIKAVVELAIRYSFSIGLILGDAQKALLKNLDLPKKNAARIELALRSDPVASDLILCNGKILLFKATIGWMPMLDAPSNATRFNTLTKAIKKFTLLKLLKFQFSTANGKKINTAASGCMIVQHYQGSLASKLVTHDNSNTDGKMSVIIVSPFSVIEYLKFLSFTLFSSGTRAQLPETIGYIKSKQIEIKTEPVLNVFIDGESATKTPLHCEVLPNAIRANLGAWFHQEKKAGSPAKESIKTDKLPDEKELEKATKKQIPFFSYASEARFRDLFMALREDARTSGIFLMLMLLSTLLATIGLYLNSAAVIIGAMLLAPLMAPIVSAAMGVLRRDEILLNDSIKTILVGLFIALAASSLISFAFPYKPITTEMQGRISPSLLDLAVAIISGIAAAYSKSHQEIIQSLAGVAIAVALVPPLAVAGIGLGRGDILFFLQAMLLFSTNLVGIILAATYTFRFLGYSPVVRSRRSIVFVLLSLLLIAIPLYFSSERIIRNINFEKSLQTERYLVNGKYIIVNNVNVSQSGDKEVILMEILVREPITRMDLIQFKKKFQYHFGEDLIIRAKISYIL